MRWLWLAWLSLMSSCQIVSGEEPRSGDGHVAVASRIEPEGPALTVAQVAAWPPAQWQHEAADQAYGLTRRAVWYRIDVALPRTSPERGWVLEFDDPLIHSLEVHLPQRPATGDGWQVIRMGNHQPFADRPLPSRGFAVPLAWPAGAAATVYVRVESGTLMHLPTRLLSQRELLDRQTRALMIDAVYIGVMGGLLLYILLVMVQVREVLYAYYAGWLLMISLFALGVSGMSFQVLWPRSPGLNDPILLLSLLVGTFLLAAFWMRSVGAHVRSKYFPSERVWLGCLVVASLIAVALPYRIAMQVTIMFALACSLGQVWLTIKAGRQGPVGMRGLPLAFMPLLVAGYLVAMQRLGLIDYIPATRHAIAIGSALQAIMLCAMLGDRLSRLRELNATALEMQRFNRTLGESNAALEATNCALRDALQLSEVRSRAIAEMKEKLRLTAEERNSEKSKFLAQAVHDLKQPLQAISIAVTPIQSLLGESADRRVVELVDVVQRASLIMRNQISGLLDLSRLESGFVRPTITPFALGPVVAPLLDPLETYGRNRGVRIELSPGEDAQTHVRSDPDLLRQILVNLIGNAIKYSDPRKAPDCMVRLQWRGSNGQVAITIEDNGIGIEAAHLDSKAIFRPFFQAHNDLPEGDKGVGLGLSIVNAALSLMPDHHMAIESQFGTGSRFTLFIPSAEAAESGPEFKALAQQVNLAELYGKYVVLVDDDVLIRRSIVALLDNFGVLHDDFGSVAELAAKLSMIERRPDVLLSDYRLPDKMTALDVMALMDQLWPKVPTVVVTGDAEVATTLADSHDIAGVMHKPVSTAELLNHLARACNLAHRNEEPVDEDAGQVTHASAAWRQHPIP